MKLGLGTVQLGLDYGISNKAGKTSEQEARKIFEIALENNLTTVDTANSYGQSEEIVGRYANGFDIITKLPRVTSEHELKNQDLHAADTYFKTSLRRLNRASIYGLLLHDANDLLAEGGSHLYELLAGYKRSGLVKKVGVSVYSLVQIQSIIKDYEIDLLQAPVNILDQRLCKGILRTLSQHGIEIHARSVFLQGLLLIEPASVDPFFEPIRPVMTALKSFVQNNGMSVRQAAIKFIQQIPEIDKMIIGVNNSEQLQEDISDYRMVAQMRTLDFSQFAIPGEEYVNPSKWRFQKDIR